MAETGLRIREVAGLRVGRGGPLRQPTFRTRFWLPAAAEAIADYLARDGRAIEGVSGSSTG